MAQSKGFEIVRFRGGDNKSTAAVARTISRAFSEDPLIRWLRPNATPWSTLTPQSMSWQQRRVERTLMEEEIHVAMDLRHEGDDCEKSAMCFPSVGFIRPPSTGWLRYFSSLSSRLRLGALDYLWPVHDDGGNMRRVDIMMTNHESGKGTVEEIAKRPAWYIEVVAVDPSYQRRSLGSQMLKHLVGLCPPGEPIYLECTDENNVPFYEKYGFKVVKMTHLIDPMVESDEGVKLWLMAKF